MIFRKTKTENRILRNTFSASLLAYVLSSVANAVGIIVDGIVIGQFLGVDSIAAFGIISPMMIIFSVSGAVISVGARNRFTKLMGQGKVKEANAVFSLSVILSLGIATLMFLTVFVFSEPITVALGATGNNSHLLPKAQDYLIGIAYGMPAMNGVRILMAYMIFDNDRNLPVWSSVAITVSDIILDLVAAIFLNGDTFEMGLATALSNWIGFGVLLTHFLKKNIMLHFSFKGINYKETSQILFSGIPNGVCRIGNSLRSTMMNRLLAIVAASTAVAAYSAQRQADVFLNPITLGMADTVAMLAGVIVGEEDRPTMKRLLKTSVRATLTLTTGMAVLAYIFAPWFVTLFIKGDPEAFSMSVRAVRCYAVGMPLYGFNLIYMNYFQGIGRNILSTVSGFLSESVLLVLSAWLMLPYLGADAIWGAFPVTQVLMMLYYTILMLAESRRMKTGRDNIWDRLLLLPKSFDVSPDDRIDISITSMDEVVALTSKAWEFCEAHNCDYKRCYMLSLAIEELAGNVIQHGFVDGKKHSIDVRVVKKDDEYFLRIRDDCLIFDPLKQMQLFKEDDPIYHLGLRMITKNSKEVKYTCILKLNNLLVKV